MRCKNIILIAWLTTTYVHAGEWQGDVEVNTGYNNNVYLESDDLQSVTAASTSSNQDLQQQLILGFGYEFLDQTHGDAKILVDHFYEKLLDNEFESSYTTVATPLSYYLGEIRYRLTPTVSRSSISGEAVLSSSGVVIDMTRKLGRYHIGMNYERYDKRALDDLYEAYQGQVSGFNIYLNSRWTGKRMGLKFGQYSNEYEETVEGNESYSGWLASASMAWWKDKGRLSLYSRVKSKEYVDYDGRNELNTLISITPSYNLTKNLNVYASVEWANNSSNLVDEFEDANYRQTITSVGGRLSF